MNRDEVMPPSADGRGDMPQGNRRPSYVWGLDLIRFAAAVMVVLFHLSWKSKDPDIGFAAGWIGVEIFFVISGFVIMGSAAGADVATFARKRFARLYPAATVCAVINLAVLIPFADLAIRNGFAVNATPRAFVDSLLLIRGPFVVGALWTLPVEIAFYALIGAIIGRGWIGHPVRIATALIGWSSLYLIPFCLSQWGVLPFRVPSLGFGMLNLTLLRHGCFFGVGILLWAVTQPRAAADRGPKAYPILWIGLVLCVVEIVASVAGPHGYAHFVDLRMLSISALATFSLAVLGMWLFARFNQAVRPGPAARSVLRHLGLVTYPLYLMHEGVGGVAFSLLLAEGFGQGFALLAGLTLSLAASWVVVIALEPWLEPRLTALAREIVVRLRFAARAGKSV